MISLSSLRAVLITFGAMTLVVGVEPVLFQAHSCSPYYCANNLSRIECGSNTDREGYLYPATEYLLEDAITRSSLCHKVPRYQVSPNILNQNYEARVTSPILLHYSRKQVEAIVYYQRAKPAMLSKPCISSSNHDDFE